MRTKPYRPQTLHSTFGLFLRASAAERRGRSLLTLTCGFRNFNLVTQSQLLHHILTLLFISYYSSITCAVYCPCFCFFSLFLKKKMSAVVIVNTVYNVHTLYRYSFYQFWNILVYSKMTRGKLFSKKYFFEKVKSNKKNNCYFKCIFRQMDIHTELPLFFQQVI